MPAPSRPGNAEGPRDTPRAAGEESGEVSGPRRPGRAAPTSDRTARETPRKPKPWSSAPASRPGGQGGLGLERSENRSASLHPGLDPASTSGATSGPPPEAGSAGVAALTLHPSCSSAFFASFVSSRQSGFWCWCPAAVSGVRPPRATHLGPPRCPAPPTSRRRQTPASGPAGRPAGGRGGDCGTCRWGREGWRGGPAAASPALDVEGTGGWGRWNRAGELPCWLSRPVPCAASPDGFTHLAPRRPQPRSPPARSVGLGVCLAHRAGCFGGTGVRWCVVLARSAELISAKCNDFQRSCDSSQHLASCKDLLHSC